MKEVSVIVIAKNKQELEPLLEALKKQSFRDFEFVTSHKKGISQALNDAISRAKGRILVVTESDVVPLTDKWLEEMIEAVKNHGEKTIVRGIDARETPWCWSNIACHASVLKKNKLDEGFPLAEDTELFCRLNGLGYTGIELPIAPVLHKQASSQKFWKHIKNSFLYSFFLTKLKRKYNYFGFSSKKISEADILKRDLKIILSRLMFIFGAFIGTITWWLEAKLINGKKKNKKPQ